MQPSIARPSVQRGAKSLKIWERFARRCYHRESEAHGMAQAAASSAHRANFALTISWSPSMDHDAQHHARHRMSRDEKYCHLFSLPLSAPAEWYDFYSIRYAGAFLPRLFFPPGNANVPWLLSAFGQPRAAGFFSGPSSVADPSSRRHRRSGRRKYTFPSPIMVMGGATFLVGLLAPHSKHRLGPAPSCFVTLRLAQGLALRGEYGERSNLCVRAFTPHERAMLPATVKPQRHSGCFLFPSSCAGL